MKILFITLSISFFNVLFAAQGGSFTIGTDGKTYCTRTPCNQFEDSANCFDVPGANYQTFPVCDTWVYDLNPYFPEKVKIKLKKFKERF